ncbi:MAG: FliH/SctL family protein [Ferrimicrobium sp.]
MSEARRVQEAIKVDLPSLDRVLANLTGVEVTATKRASEWEEELIAARRGGFDDGLAHARCELESTLGLERRRLSERVTLMERVTQQLAAAMEEELRHEVGEIVSFSLAVVREILATPIVLPVDRILLVIQEVICNATAATSVTCTVNPELIEEVTNAIGAVGIERGLTFMVVGDPSLSHLDVLCDVGLTSFDGRIEAAVARVGDELRSWGAPNDT